MIDWGMMRLERRRVRNDHTETFYFLYYEGGAYVVSKAIFLKLDDSGRRGHDQKLFKRVVDLM